MITILEDFTQLAIQSVVTDEAGVSCTTVAIAITMIQTRKNSINPWVLLSPLITFKDRNQTSRRCLCNPTLILAAICHFVQL